jgi:hypothetical protein
MKDDNCFGFGRKIDRIVRAGCQNHRSRSNALTGNGRPPVGVERMLRIYFLQQWFNLSDPAVEEAKASYQLGTRACHRVLPRHPSRGL